MNTQKKRAFVTGASGFVGAHLVYVLLEKGYIVSALVRSQKTLNAFSALAHFYPAADSGKVEWIEGDLLSPEKWVENVAHADVVFHAAAVVSFSPRDKRVMLETNVTGTTHVVNACLKHNPKPLVYVSSVAALGRAEGQTEVTENTTWKDSDHNTSYAISKHLAEREVWRGMEEGLPVVVVCPGIILGPWANPTGSGQIPALIKKKLPFYPIGENGFVGVRDVVAMMIGLYESGCFGERFLCVAENTTYKNVLDLFAYGFDVRPPRIALNGALLHFLVFIARFFEIVRIPFPFPSQGLISTSLVTRYASIRLNPVLGYSYTPLKRVVRECVDFNPY